MNKKKAYHAVIIALAFSGALFSYILAQDYHFAALYRETGVGLSVFTDLSAAVCGQETSAINCNAVKESGYSRMIGVPLHAWGLTFFLIALLSAVVLLKLSSNDQKRGLTLLFWYAAFGSIITLLLFAVQLFVIRAFCPLCLTTYVSNWALLFVIFLFLRSEGGRPGEAVSVLQSFFRQPRDGRMAAAIIALVIIVSAAAALGTDRLLVHRKENYINDKIIGPIVKKMDIEPMVFFKFSSNQVIGNPRVPLTIMVFSDFMCPHCKIAGKTLSAIVRRMPAKVKVVFMNFPLDSSCNPSVKSPQSSGTCIFAKGAVCAAKQRGFERYHDALLAHNPESATLEEAREAAVSAALNLGEFDACMSSPEAEKELKVQIETATGIGVTSTPTILINRKQYRYKVSADIIEHVIKNELHSFRKIR